MRAEFLRFTGAVARDPAIDAWMKEYACELGAIAHQGYPVVCLGARSVDVNVFCPQPSLHAQSGSVSIAGGPLPQQVLRVFNGNS